MVKHDPEIIKRYPTRRLRVEDGCLKKWKVTHCLKDGKRATPSLMM